MRKSGTGLSTEPGPAARREAGFSLIELLVVIVVLAIAAASVVLSTGTLRADDPVETEARRLVALMRFIAEEALIQGRDFGVEFAPGTYRFLSWDPDTRLWSVIDDEAALRARELPADLEFALAIDGREVVLEQQRRDRPADELVPQVAIFSSGELTPFELFVVGDYVADAWQIRGLVNGEVELAGPGRGR
ncbi:type II secretion system minor pseudopilin GspH [Thioalkalivibrio sp. XN8]|uniref:type II secretion system minor pseudopilin GspH n=1 Tax=Thioalkalivibrio sp. XN8 TaxID=2712863 RepID=UPI0013EABEC1|nr:type II secretion system minor pseudopilin GspH [Thioalkalivibrio sp. XN8]NGP54670.1 type II secretion system minor pseudopilin GspH [Thioalkalivibrio sp. XN8]